MFRMEQCGLDTLTVRLPYAREEGVYTLTDEDSKEVYTCSGEQLKKKGFTSKWANKRTSRLLWVEKQ